MVTHVLQHPPEQVHPAGPSKACKLRLTSMHDLRSMHTAGPQRHATPEAK